MAGQRTRTSLHPAASQLALMAFTVAGSFTYVMQPRKQGESEELTSC